MNLLKKASILITFLPFFSFAQNNYNTSLATALKDTATDGLIKFGSSEGDPHMGDFQVLANRSEGSSLVMNNPADAHAYQIVTGEVFTKNEYINKFHTARLAHLKDTGEFIEQRYIRFFVGAGLSFNTISISGTTPIYNLSPASYTSTGPKISAGINIYPVPNVGRSLLRLEVSYMTASYKTMGDLYYEAPVITAAYQFQQHSFSIIPQFQYNVYNADQFKFYIDAGFSVNISNYTGNQVYNSYTLQTQTDYLSTNKLWFSVPIKAGVILKRNIEISLAYIYSQSISNNVSGTHQDFDYSINIHSLQLSLNYLF